MKQQLSPRTARALAPFFAATALVATPALAQETPQAAPPQTTAPAAPAPVVTPPRAASVTIPPIARTVPDGTPAAAAAAEPAAPRAAPRAASRPTATRAATRTVTRSRATTTTAAPAPRPAAPDPVAVTPPPAPAAAPVDQPAPVAADSAQSNTTTTTFPLWAWIAAGVAGLAIVFGALFALRRRRDEYAYDEPSYVEEPYVEPVAVAPVVAPLPVAKVQPRKEPEVARGKAKANANAGAIEPVIAAPDEVHVSEPAAAEVAELTSGTAPVAERPWLEFAMRPVRAGTNVDEALVEIELTVGNSGSVSAKDVRISTFLLSGDVRRAEMEKLLINPPSDATTDPVTIKPGEGKRIDATLALLKADMGENLPSSFRPVVVADARYTMADGSEGRTSASFLVGVTPEEGTVLEPIELSRSSMHDNVGAELQGEAVHA
ncbi:MAG: hypothetical protein V4459_15160 [Pseudomonadota bacterium]